MTRVPEITRLLAAARDGDSLALDNLLPGVYEELRAIARRHRHSLPGNHTLNTTAVVHEAYLKVFHRGDPDLQDRAHFFSVACLAMRQVLVDAARRRLAARRGGGADHLALTDHEPGSDDQLEGLLALDEALQGLRRCDERLATVVEMRYFGGLSVDEIAELRGQSARTVARDWQRARAYLAEALT